MDSSITLTVEVVPAPGMEGKMMTTTSISSPDSELKKKIDSNKEFYYSATIAAVTLAAVTVATDLNHYNGSCKQEVIDVMYAQMKRMIDDFQVAHGPSPRDN